METFIIMSIAIFAIMLVAIALTKLRVGNMSSTERAIQRRANKTCQRYYGK